MFSFLKVRVPRSDYKVQSQITDCQFLVEWLLREFRMDSFWTTVFIIIEEKTFSIYLEVFFYTFFENSQKEFKGKVEESGEKLE